MYLVVEALKNASTPPQYCGQGIVFCDGFKGDAQQDFLSHPEHWTEVGSTNILGRISFLKAPQEVWAVFREMEPLTPGMTVDDSAMSCSPIPERDTVRFSNGHNSGRVTFHPDYDHHRPWVSYIGGTAGQHFASIDDAEAYFAGRGFRRESDATLRPRMK